METHHNLPSFDASERSRAVLRADGEHYCIDKYTAPPPCTGRKPCQASADCLCVYMSQMPRCDEFCWACSADNVSREYMISVPASA